MNLGIDLNEELDFSAPCGALTAMYVIGGLMMSGILITVAATFSALRRRASIR